MASPLVLKVAIRDASGHFGSKSSGPQECLRAGVPRQRRFLFVVLKGGDQPQEMER